MHPVGCSQSKRRDWHWHVVAVATHVGVVAIAIALFVRGVFVETFLEGTVEDVLGFAKLLAGLLGLLGTMEVDVEDLVVVVDVALVLVVVRVRGNERLGVELGLALDRELEGELHAGRDVVLVLLLEQRAERGDGTGKRGWLRRNRRQAAGTIGDFDALVVEEGLRHLVLQRHPPPGRVDREVTVPDAGTGEHEDVDGAVPVALLVVVIVGHHRNLERANGVVGIALSETIGQSRLVSKVRRLLRCSSNGDAESKRLLSGPKIDYGDQGPEEDSPSSLPAITPRYYAKGVLWACSVGLFGGSILGKDSYAYVQYICVYAYVHMYNYAPYL